MPVNAVSAAKRKEPDQSMGGDDAGGQVSSAAGARVAGGMAFQAEVFAWWAARAVADVEPGLGLDPSARIEAVGCETGFPVDDVGIAVSGGGFILVQAKGGLRRLDSRAEDLCKAVDQLVGAMTSGIRTAAAVRPVDLSRDRLVIATNQHGSRAFDALGKVCARLRDHPAALPLDDAAKTGQERAAFATFRHVIELRWTAATKAAPTEEQLRQLLRVVEIQRLDFDTDAGADRIRSETLLDHAQAANSYSALVEIGLGVARERSWRQRHTLATMLGVPGNGMGSAPSDVERLKELTRSTLARLDGHRVLSTPDGDVRLQRQFIDVLGLVPHSLLITGMPGAGKSGVVADLADLLPGDQLVLAVDAVPPDRALAQVQWNLTVDLAEVLRAWDGPEPATLLLDGLDAHRGGASWLADLVGELQGTRWRVVATIREFELTYSYKWKQLFRGTPIGPAAANPQLSQVRHLVIPNFDESDLAKIAKASPSLGALLDAGGDQLRELLANPFNLSLAADLVAQVPLEHLAALRTQVQALAIYWQVRVLQGSGKYARNEALRELVERMTASRCLEIVPGGGMSGVDQHAVEQLVSSGVLQEVDDNRLVMTTKPIRFRHHIVFDFALAAGLRSPHASRLPQVLTADPEFVVFGRPAIDFHLADLWLTEADRHSFWDTTTMLAESGSPLAVAAAAATSVRQIDSAADVQGLIYKARTRPEPATVVVNHLASAMGAADEMVRAHVVANIAVFDELTGALGTVWLEDADPERLHAMIRLMWALNTLSPLPRQGPAANEHAASIVRMLEIALVDPASRRWLVERVLHFIVGALPLDPRAVPALLRCLDQDVISTWGLLPLRPVLEKLGDIAQVDATTAGRLAIAPFLFDASGEGMVSIGFSQILGLNESWSQAHSGLRYGVATRGWASFEEANPVVAMEALATILERFADTEGKATALSWNGLAGQVGSSSYLLGVADRRDAGKLVAMTIAAMAARASEGDDNYASLRIWTTRITHPDAWEKLLLAGAAEPPLGMQLRSALLETGGLFADLSTRSAAIQLAKTLSPLISDDEHKQLEQIIVNLPGAEPDDDLQQFLATARDQALDALDPSRIQTDAAKARLDELANTDIEPTTARPWGSLVKPPPFDDDDQWSQWGSDPTTLSESVRIAMINTGTALAEGVQESERWSALSSAVVAERDLDADSILDARLRYRIGRLIDSLLSSDRIVPDDHLGTWIIDLIVALADNSLLPLPPEVPC